jgi:hypothetical protein
VKFESTRRFDNDFKALSKEHQTSFRDLMPDFNDACDAYAIAQGGFVWPMRLRVNKLTSAKGIWEMTWSFASPDGRATFEFVNTSEGVRLRWRRIGNHDVFREP